MGHLSWAQTVALSSVEKQNAISVPQESRHAHIEQGVFFETQYPPWIIDAQKYDRHPEIHKLDYMVDY